jgi:hypothetical protein
MPKQRVIGLGPSKGICSQNESLDTKDTRPTTHLYGWRNYSRIAEDSFGKEDTMGLKPIKRPLRERARLLPNFPLSLDQAPLR